MLNKIQLNKNISTKEKENIFSEIGLIKPVVKV